MASGKAFLALLLLALVSATYARVDFLEMFDNGASDDCPSGKFFHMSDRRVTFILNNKENKFSKKNQCLTFDTIYCKSKALLNAFH